MTVIDTLLQRPPSEIPFNPKTIYRPDLQDEIARQTNKPLQAALYLLNDDIHSAHMIAQEGEGNQALDYVHMMLHRREGDFWNSRCWVDLVKHPLMVELWGKNSGELEEAREHAKDFVNRVEAASKGKDSADEQELKQLQFKEFKAAIETFARA